MSQNHAIGLRERKREATHDRIAGEAPRLALEQGVIATTVDQIADAAAVGRASFFRYFDSKELAIAAGFVGVWLHLILAALERQSQRPSTHRGFVTLRWLDNPDPPPVSSHLTTVVKLDG
jgi:AcrR family transcriptional regulator